MPCFPPILRGSAPPRRQNAIVRLLSNKATKKHAIKQCAWRPGWRRFNGEIQRIRFWRTVCVHPGPLGRLPVVLEISSASSGARAICQACRNSGRQPTIAEDCQARSVVDNDARHWIVGPLIRFSTESSDCLSSEAARTG